jgi:hypothetical protein
MATLKLLRPDCLIKDAEKSGFFQCPDCGLIWFGRPDIRFCPDNHNARPIPIAVLCRECDKAIPIEQFAEHLQSREHSLT